MAKHSHSHEHPCTDPVHHVHDADAFVKAVEQACDARGLRLTPLRAQALGLIAAETKPIKAYDLLDKMKTEKGNADRPRSIAPLIFYSSRGLSIDWRPSMHSSVAIIRKYNIQSLF